MITFDLSGLTPIERAAVEYMMSLPGGAEGQQPPATVEEFVAAYLRRGMEAWKESLIAAKLPELRPHAEVLLDLSAEDQAATVAFMHELRRRAGALDDGAGAIDTAAG